MPRDMQIDRANGEQFEIYTHWYHCPNGRCPANSNENIKFSVIQAETKYCPQCGVKVIWTGKIPEGKDDGYN